MDVTAYTKALISYAEQIGTCEPLEKERDLLFAKLTNGGDGKMLESTTVNGKSFGWKVTLTLEEKFRCFVEAIKTFNGASGDSPITFLDFSRSSERFPMPSDGFPWIYP